MFCSLYANIRRIVPSQFKWLEYQGAANFNRERLSPRITELLGLLGPHSRHRRCLQRHRVFRGALSLATLALRATGHRAAAQAGHHIKTIDSLELTLKAQRQDHSEIQNLQQQAEQISLRRCRCYIGPGIAVNGKPRERIEKQHHCMAARSPLRAIGEVRPRAGTAHRQFPITDGLRFLGSVFPVRYSS
jgi:hypothetical protein